MLIGSDLDLTAIYEERQSGTGPEYEKSIAELVRIFKGEGGLVYDWDFRLRPEGKNAPLAAELSYYGQYLKSRAELWEKQSLLKARPIFSDQRVASGFESLRRVTLSGVAREKGWVAEIRRMRKKIENERTKEKSRLRDLKVGRGGLVDLEFAVQAVQLKNFAMHQSVDSGNSFDALRALHALRLVRMSHVKALQRNYEFLRRLEFFTRLNSDSIEFILPSDPIRMGALAAAMNTRSPGELMAKIRKIRSENRLLFRILLSAMET